jgi:hypothetical protein
VVQDALGGAHPGGRRSFKGRGGLFHARLSAKPD